MDSVYWSKIYELSMHVLTSRSRWWRIRTIFMCLNKTRIIITNVHVSFSFTIHVSFSFTIHVSFQFQCTRVISVVKNFRLIIQWYRQISLKNGC